MTGTSGFPCSMTNAYRLKTSGPKNTSRLPAMWMMR